MYSCPCYYFPNRAGGSGRRSFVQAGDLKGGAGTSDHWVKRGTYSSSNVSRPLSIHKLHFEMDQQFFACDF